VGATSVAMLFVGATSVAMLFVGATSVAMLFVGATSVAMLFVGGPRGPKALNASIALSARSRASVCVRCSFLALRTWRLGSRSSPGGEMFEKAAVASNAFARVSSAPRTSHFSLLAQRKVTKRKGLKSFRGRGTPSARAGATCWLRGNARCIWSIHISFSNTIRRRGCHAKRASRVRRSCRRRATSGLVVLYAVATQLPRLGRILKGFGFDDELRR
jgi:hypothetical protein